MDVDYSTGPYRGCDHMMGGGSDLFSLVEYAIQRIKSHKQRPSEERIQHMLGSSYKVPPQHITSFLDEACGEGKLVRVSTFLLFPLPSSDETSQTAGWHFQRVNNSLYMHCIFVCSKYTTVYPGRRTRRVVLSFARFAVEFYVAAKE